jgi:hypothetical protein
VDQGVLLPTIVKSRRDACRQRYSALEASYIAVEILVAVDFATLTAHTSEMTIPTFPHIFAAKAPFVNGGTYQVRTFISNL